MDPEGQAILRARGLVKSFKKIDAVRGVDLDVHAGARVALLGPNGAGKTTTLLMLLGAITPDAGWVEIGGHRMPKGRSHAMEQVGFSAGYLPFPDRLRVSEVLWMFGRLAGLRDPSSVIAESLERFRIAHLAPQMCLELSSGQRTLVGIVKAVLHRPRLLVLDEPTASLDPDVAYRVRAGLTEYCDESGSALLITSHNMVEVERLCDRVVFLSAGRITADGSAAEVAAQFGRGNLEDVFLQLAGTQPPKPADLPHEEERML